MAQTDADARLTAIEAQIGLIREQLASVAERMDVQRSSGKSAAIDLKSQHGSETIHLELPAFGGAQLQEARALFRIVGRLGVENLSSGLVHNLSTYHIIFAASTRCEVWSGEWDRIIDEALDLVAEGAQRVVDFIRAELRRAGFPQWAIDSLATVIDAILSLGEAELAGGLELARYSGRLGLWLRCHWPF